MLVSNAEVSFPRSGTNGSLIEDTTIQAPQEILLQTSPNGLRNDDDDSQHDSTLFIIHHQPLGSKPLVSEFYRPNPPRKNSYPSLSDPTFFLNHAFSPNHPLQFNQITRIPFPLPPSQPISSTHITTNSTPQHNTRNPYILLPSPHLSPSHISDTTNIFPFPPFNPLSPSQDSSMT